MSFLSYLLRSSLAAIDRDWYNLLRSLYYGVPVPITSINHKGVTFYGLRGRGVESRSLMTSVETRDLSGKVDRSRVKNNTKRVGKSRHVDGGMFTTVAILNEKRFDP